MRFWLPSSTTLSSSSALSLAEKTCGSTMADDRHRRHNRRNEPPKKPSSTSSRHFNGLSTVVLLYFTVALCNSYLIGLVTAINTHDGGGTGRAEFEYCLRQRQIGTIGTCLGHQYLRYLQRIEDSNNVTIVEGLELVRAKDGSELGSQSRSVVNFLDMNPADFRGIFDSLTTVMSSRSMKWDMDMIYPGLQMRVGPYQGTNSLLEFAMDTDIQEADERKSFYAAGKTSVGRALTKSFILPFLLGFKFNLSLVLPLLIGLLIIVGKKIVFISKLVLILSGIFGWGGPFAGNTLGYGGGLNNHHYGHKPLYNEGFYKDGQYADRIGGGRASAPLEPTERPYEFDRFYDFERNQNRYDKFSMYDDEFRPRQEEAALPQTPTIQKKQFAWRTTTNK